MSSIGRILVAVKTPTARRPPLIAKAAQLARASNATLELFHALDAPLLVELLGSDELAARNYNESAGKALERLAERVRARGVRVTTRVEWDFPAAEAIVRRAAAMRADLIVAGRHAGRHRAAWLLGLTDWELLRKSPVPVLLVKTASPYRRPVVLAAIDPSHAFAKPSRLDDEILKAGEAVTGAMRGSLHVLHSYLPEAFVPPPLSQPIEPGLTLRLKRDAERAAGQRFERALAAKDIPAARRHLIESHPADAIPTIARRTRSAIVVMGAVSRSGLKRVFIGNTAERVLDRLPCDLLIVKPKAFASRVARSPRGVHWIVAPPLGIP